MAKDGLHVVFGVNGNLGRAVSTALLRRGLAVRGVSRSEAADLPSQIETRLADAFDPVSMREAAKGASAVYHCMAVTYPHWATHLPVMMSSLIEAAAAQGAGTRVIYGDNLYCYGKEGALRGPLSEGTPYLARGPKGRLRAELVGTLLRAHRAGRLRAAIGHASDFYGPGATSSVFHMFAFPRIVRGQKVRMLADVDRKHSVIFLDDFAEALVELGTSDAAFGKTWIVPHGEVVTIRRFLELCFRAAGVDPAGRIGRLPKATLAVGGLFSPLVREVREVIYQFHVDWVADSSRFEKSFSFRATPLSEAIERTVRWYRERAS